MAALRLLGVILAAFVVCAGLTGYPIPFGDATYFMPASIQLANGHGLTNPVFARARAYDALGLARFIYHGFTFEVVLAALIKPLMGLYAAASIASVAALGVIHAAVILALSETCVPFLRRSRNATLAGGIAALGLTAFSALMFSFGGRPEELAVIPVCLVVVAILISGITSGTVILCGVCTGIVASISPIPAVLSSLVLSAYLASVEDLRSWLLHSISVGTLAVVTFFGVTVAIYPYPVTDLIEGIEHHAAAVETGFALDIWGVFVANPDVPVFGLVLLLVVMGGTWSVLTRRRGSERAVLAALAVLLVAALIRFVFNKFLIYNIVPLWPAFLGFLLWSTGKRLGRGPRDLIWPAIILIALGLPSIGFFRMALLYPMFLQDGVKQARAQVLFARQLTSIEDPTLFVSRSGFLLTDDYTRIIDYAEQIARGKVIVVMQYRSGRQTPAELPGFRLIYENFTRDAPKLFGVSVARTIPGYGFAIYRPIGRVTHRIDRRDSATAAPGARLGELSEHAR